MTRKTYFIYLPQPFYREQFVKILSVNRYCSEANHVKELWNQNTLCTIESGVTAVSFKILWLSNNYALIWIMDAVSLQLNEKFSHKLLTNIWPSVSRKKPSELISEIKTILFIYILKRREYLGSIILSLIHYYDIIQVYKINYTIYFVFFRKRISHNKFVSLIFIH